MMLHSRVGSQAKAVVAYLDTYGGIGYNRDTLQYDAHIDISEWYNGREVGYVLTMLIHTGDGPRQLNIIFFEHRNSDSIAIVKWEQYTGLNPPNITTADFGDIYKDKYDLSVVIPYGQAADAAEWIYEELSDFWEQCVGYTYS